MPLFVVVVAVPHYVLSGGSFSFASWVVALVGAYELCGFAAVWGAYAASDDGFESALGICVCGVFVGCVFKSKVNHDSVVIEYRVYADHVFSKAFMFFGLMFAVWSAVTWRCFGCACVW